MTAEAQSRGASTPSAAPSAAGWPGLLLVSLFAVAICTALAWVPKVLGDPDTYWHIAAGEWILDHRQIPHVDPFSYTFAGQPWTAHEWLSEVLLALSFRAAGWAGVMAVAATAFATAIAAFGQALRKWLPTPALIGVLVFAAFGAGPSLLARPHLLAAPVFVAWLAGLLAARDANRAPSPWLLPLMLLWANLHGSFVLGLALVGAFALEAVMLNAERLWSQVRGWALFGLAATAMAMVTPHGFAGLIFPFKLMGMASLPVIAEWRSADFSHLSLFEIVLLEGLFFCLWLGVRVPIVRLLLLLGFFHLALAHERHQLLFVLTAGLVLAQPFADALALRAGRPAAVPASVRTPRWWVPALGIAFLLAAGVRSTVPVVRHDDVTPHEALAAVGPELRRRPVFNDYDFGGFLIFNGVRPYIDGRADLYGDAFVMRYSAMVEGGGDTFLRELDRRSAAWTMLTPASPMVRVLDATPGWRRLWADRTAVVHVRTTGSGTAAPPIPTPG
jgi:hypothetical protein